MKGKIMKFCKKIFNYMFPKMFSGIFVLREKFKNTNLVLKIIRRK